MDLEFSSMEFKDLDDFSDEDTLGLYGGESIDDSVFMDSVDETDPHDNQLFDTLNPLVRNLPILSELVESSLIDLLEEGDYGTLIALGDNARSLKGVDPTLARDYVLAVIYNPALKWYCNFASMCGEGFFVENGDLVVELPANKLPLLKKFADDFNPKLVSDSPMVSLVRFLLNSQDGSRGLGVTVDQGLNVDDDSMNVSSMDFSEMQLDVDDFPLNQNDFTLDENPGIGNPEFGAKGSQPTLSLMDLSTKAIADYLYSSGYTDYDLISKQLSNEGFKTHRINEIIGVLRYKMVDSHNSRQSIKGSYGFCSNLDIEV